MKQRTFLQEEAQRHNWNKAMVVSAKEQIKRIVGSGDVRMPKSIRALLVVAYWMLKDALEEWK